MDTSPDRTEGPQSLADRLAKTDLGTRAAHCPEHGPFTATGRIILKREIWTSCPACARAREQAEQAEKLAAAAQRERERLDRMLRESGIPERLKHCTFDNYVEVNDAASVAKRAVHAWFAGFDSHLKTGESLILAGRPGTGKGHLSAAGMAGLMPRYLPIYTTCLDMIRSVRATWRRESEHSELQVLQAYEDAPLLVIDEIGVQYDTEGEKTIIFDVLDRRYRQMVPTIFITNQDRTGFQQFIGERAYDRLKQTARWVSFDWESYRSKARVGA